MAKMIPQIPKNFHPASQEGTMFSSLEKLPSEYYVFHSFRIVKQEGDVITESETDFVIFHKNKGIMCIEAKAGHVKCVDGIWCYSNLDPMKYNGPYEQAIRGKWKIYNYIREHLDGNILSKCNFYHAVWFPSISKQELDFNILPSETEAAVTLTKEDLENPLSKIENIFSLNIPRNTKTNLSDKNVSDIIKKVLCPNFDLIPSATMELDLDKQVFHKMLNEQKNVLNYLVYQRSAVIQGVAGTGKTLIALEKARRHADEGEKVLFLCYNSMLHEYIAAHNEHPFIDFYTIDGFACKLCRSAVANYNQVKEILEDFYLEGNFEYKHVIIDEGQDFGQDNIEENDIIELLENIIIDRDDSVGTFYIFYDSMQHVQGNKIPDYITNADCKLTLYKNCRNTENIAITSLKPIRTTKPKLIDGCISGKLPRIYYVNNNNERAIKIGEVIENYKNFNITDIVILTCKTERTSALSSEIVNGKYHGRYLFTTCRKYKGLEADAIIMVDVDEDVLLTDAAKVFYVGASRARLQLTIVADMDKDACINVLNGYGITKISRNPKKQLATELNSMIIL
mgnify:CR=1 FL=1